MSAPAKGAIAVVRLDFAARSGFAARWLAAGVVALSVATPASAQDYRHPKEMGLPAPDFERPNPDAMRIELPNGLAAYVALDERAPLATLTAFVGAGNVLLMACKSCGYLEKTFLIGK